jgi:predicted Fe-Mo cluster-binding NifX family protein
MRVATLRVGEDMTRLAIPYFGSRVAPRLDGARSLLLLDIENDEVRSRQSVEIKSRTSADTLRFMKEHGVEVIICGGIDQHSLRLLRSRGINIFSWITGEVDDAIRLFLAGNLKTGTMLDLRGRGRGAGRGAEGSDRPYMHQHEF